ncbi:glutamate--cysteine ligase [Rivularia sp. UHCC 0363]|uniref:glutamate--cysteine ligase n=1 Tax=Rivularia sp. UHCC 0363 TaxID=3110244 RepID=UPI002B200BFF|nr:glutamate--cysteine ligase [Rivularia sp. UHCC 0363]MEA5595191.1 glutamate--cysteine ligase [Rivularia sp. UHCC 0363]
MFHFGIEHEVAFIDNAGKFADFSRVKFADFNQIVEKLPVYKDDYPELRIGDAGIKEKRWYIEGFERFTDSEKVIECVPKGIEIRTTINPDIHSAIAELTESFRLLKETAAEYGFSPALISFNPHYDAFVPNPPLNEYETIRRNASPEKQTANIPMLTYGPDLNISMVGLTTERIIDIGKKLTFYSPYIIPFSYSSPFYQGTLWSGFSVRTFVRTGIRPATMVFLEKQEELIKSVPSLTKIARIPAEIGRIEFKAFDSCSDFSIYAGLLALLKGLILDESLLGRAIVPDAEKHKISAQEGFDREDIFNHAKQILQAVETALADDPDIEFLTPLKTLLQKRETPAHELVRLYKHTGSIEAVLKQTYHNS